ncbi:MAG: hypothetical protein JOZ33_11960 [Acidobacteriaceae bacterium]|nr:hypothetical protein [Acidobacteriaceae bacterium]
MIVSPSRRVLAVVIRDFAGALCGLIAWDLFVVFCYKVLHWGWLGVDLPIGAFGTALSIIVGLRNGSAYNRWWEARTLWGAIVNKSRTLARQVVTTLSAGPDATAEEESEVAALQRHAVLYQVAYVQALRQQLRGLDPLPEVARVVDEAEQHELASEKNVALALQRRMGDLLVRATRRGWLNNWHWQAIDRSMDGLMDAQGGAERIKNTPMPKQFDFLPRLFIQIYCIVLPFGLVDSLGWFTPLGSTLVGFMFLALEKIGRDLERPFENSVHDVSMTAIATNIEINLRQLLGETELPAVVRPVHGILW